MFRFLLFWGIWNAAVAFVRFIRTPLGILTILALYLWGSFGDSDQVKKESPHPQDITMVDYGIKFSHISYPRSLKSNNVDWVSLTITNSYEKPFQPKYALCVIEGPVYYAMPNRDNPNGALSNLASFRSASRWENIQYLGQRRLFVKLIEVGIIPFFEGFGIPEISSASRGFVNPYQTHPTRGIFHYVTAAPRTVLLPDDVVTDCKFYENNPPIASTIAWVGDHSPADWSIFVDNHVDQDAANAIIQASAKGLK